MAQVFTKCPRCGERLMIEIKDGENGFSDITCMSCKEFYRIKIKPIP